MRVIPAGSSLGVKWSSTPRSAGTCQVWVSLASPPIPAQHLQNTLHPGLELPGAKRQTLAAERAASRNSPALFCWFCPSKTHTSHQCQVAGRALVPAGFPPAPSSVPASPWCSQPRCSGARSRFLKPWEGTSALPRPELQHRRRRLRHTQRQKQIPFLPLRRGTSREAVEPQAGQTLGASQRDVGQEK